jgi:hypothetical protein
MAEGSCLDDALSRRRQDASLATSFRVQTCLLPTFKEQISRVQRSKSAESPESNGLLPADSERAFKSRP